MLEILNAYETAKNEKNKFLRFFYINYTKGKLKKFFKVFKESNVYINRDFLIEFIKFYRCTYSENEIFDYGNAPHVSLVYPSDNLNIQYGIYKLHIAIVDEENCEMSLTAKGRNMEALLHPTFELINLDEFLRTIIFSAIYNYCVMYIYGNNANFIGIEKSVVKGIEYILS